jgi:2-hydroxy-3-oxopropionate reductase
MAASMERRSGGPRRVGFAGMGVMGLPMARRLLEAGFEVTVWNRSPERCEPLVAGGAGHASTLAELARAADVAVTMLVDDAAVRASCEQLIEAAEAGTVIVDMSTVAPGTAVDLHRLAGERGLEFVDAPVSGGERGAIEGSLAVMVGGEVATVERVAPVLEPMAAKVVRVGGPGAGQLAKAVNQVMVGLVLQAVAEGLTLGIESGIDPNVLIDALRGGFADSTVFRVHGPRMAASEFEPGGRIALHLKDLRIALGAADGVGLELPATAQLARVMEDLVEKGAGDLDQAAIVRAYRDLR